MGLHEYGHKYPFEYGYDYYNVYDYGHKCGNALLHMGMNMDTCMDLGRICVWIRM